nr:ATP-binding protein [uncultured Lachnoanaerobaculum sp.]
MSLKEQMSSNSVGQKVRVKDLMENKPLISDPAASLLLAEKIVKKLYLNDLERYKVSKPGRSVLELSTDRNIKMFKISGLVFDKDENILDRLNNVYSSMHGLGLSIVFMLKSDGISIELYMGTKSVEEDFTENPELGKAFEKSFRGNFPGSQISDVDIFEYNDIVENILPKNGENTVTALTGLPSIKDKDAHNEQFIQGIEKFVDAMQGEVFTVLIISDPISDWRIEQVKQGYGEVYSQMSSLAEYSLTVGTNEGISISESEMKGYTDTIGKSVSKTQSFTKGSSKTKSESITNTIGISAELNGGGSVAQGTSDATSLSANAGSKIPFVSVGIGIAKTFASSLTSTITGGASIGVNASRAYQHGTSVGTNESESEGIQKSSQESTSTTNQSTSQKGMNNGSSTSSMIKFENKQIKVFLECVDEHLKRIKECENYGMWASAAYFISNTKETSIISASAYRGIINGEGTSLESANMNTWFRDDSTKMINEYLRHFTHPRFYDPDYLINFEAITDVTPATMLSTKELSVQCGIPYNGVPGIFVREMARFGRDVQSTKNVDLPIRLGNIYHMGKEYDKHVVNIDLKRLGEHTFITGSTGSGKSNTVYSLVARLNKLLPNDYPYVGQYIDKQIPTLIIEPAKGEYKQVFGDKFNVYGTNPAITELLRINPFKFENGIHVLEHIDRLVDIFNVCWPMYAAMPAVLKEAIEKAYASSGWDLRYSKNINGIDIYPSFMDLLQALREVVSSSEYSKEVKDNYTGSLVTRVRSLTNGLNGQIFTADEIDSKKLFNESTIIDLSRVGSSETKSLIMGIIIMRLQERRMCEGGINLPLKHVTVIEEAHNLLRRVSTEQTSESSNLLGKSVEMIANAIAEMRTYGEGFVIVDQSPSLLDMSVIRNTNTKVIMHLPDLTDRELVGRAAGLTDSQIVELAKIPTGVAAVYQNKWVEAVLCKIDKYNIEPKEYKYQYKKVGNSQLCTAKVIEYLLSNLKNREVWRDIEKIKRFLVGADISSSAKCEIISSINLDKKLDRNKVERIISNIVDGDKDIFSKVKYTDNIVEWNSRLIQELNISTEQLSIESLNSILECLIHFRSLENSASDENFNKWMQEMKRRVV